MVQLQRLKCFAKEQWWYLLAFLLPFLILGGVYALFGMYPFGDKSVLIADLNSQYVDYYSNFRDLLTEGGSLLYNWNAGMGLNYVGILSYYLMSPFSFLILCFSKANITEAIGLMIVLKIGCSGLTFSILAKKKFDFTPVFCLLFSCLYALSSYAVVYTSNPMWLDALILLPLLILSIDAMVQKGKFFPFTVVLFCLFVTNYYISYMVGIFAFLYFLAQSICAKNGLFLRRLGTFFAATLLSVGLAAVVLLPSAMNLFDSYQKVRTLQISFELAMEPEIGRASCRERV